MKYLKFTTHQKVNGTDLIEKKYCPSFESQVPFGE